MSIDIDKIEGNSKSVEYSGDTTIEAIERGNDLDKAVDAARFNESDIMNIDDKLDGIEAAIKRSNSFETELGVVGKLRGVLDKMKSGLLGLGDIDNLLKQVTGLKEGLGNDIKNIKNLERKAKLRDKKIDDALKKSEDLINMLKERQAKKENGIDDFSDYIDKLMKDVERIKEQAEKEKKVLEPFIYDLQKRLDAVKEYEDGMANLLGKIQEELERRRELIIKDMPEKDKEKDVPEPEEQKTKDKETKGKDTKDKGEGEKDKSSKEEAMQEEFRALATGIVKLLVDWGKTEEAFNMLNSFTYNQSEGNKKIEIEASSKNEIDSLKSKSKMKQVEQSTVKLEGQANLQKVKESNKNINNSMQKDNEKSFTK